MQVITLAAERSRRDDKEQHERQMQQQRAETAAHFERAQRESERMRREMEMENERKERQMQETLRQERANAAEILEKVQMANQQRQQHVSVPAVTRLVFFKVADESSLLHNAGIFLNFFYNECLPRTHKNESDATGCGHDTYIIATVDHSQGGSQSYCSSTHQLLLGSCSHNYIKIKNLSEFQSDSSLLCCL